MRRLLGIQSSRRAIVLAGVTATSGKHTLELSRIHPRTPSGKLTTALADAIGSIPDEWHGSELVIAISAADLACADCFHVPYHTEREISEVSSSLAESRCAGATSEELAADVTMLSHSNQGSTIEVSSISQQLLKEIRESVRTVLPRASLRLVCSVPAALAAAVPPTSGSSVFVLPNCGEAVTLEFKNGAPVSWRSLPINGSAGHVERIASEMGVPTEALKTYVADEQLQPTVVLKNSFEVPLGIAVAVAAAIAPNSVCNLLRGAPDAPRNALVKLWRPLTLTAFAAAGLMLVAGLWFGKQAEFERAELNSIQQQERGLWASVLPAEAYKQGALGTRMKQILVQENKIADANRFPSALAFWSEMASVFPNADTIGMTVDSMQLSPEGGRLSGRVKRGIEDPLSNAAGLEAALNKSKNLSAWGEFETKENDVVVRMQLDYRSPQPKREEQLK